MAEQQPTPNWMREWQAMQEQFLSAWREAMRATEAAEGLPLHEGLDLWVRLANGRSGHSALIERMVASARQVVELMQGALAAADTTRRGTGESDTASWRRAMAQAFGTLDLEHNPVLEALRSVTGEGAQNFEQMAVQARVVVETLSASMQRLSSLPAFGPTRELQERQQKLMRALAELAEAERAYQALMLTASRTALSRFEAKLAEREAPGRQIRSTRELYDLWIDAAEEGYAEVAMSPEFRRAYADMVDAQMRVRQGVQREVEWFTGLFGMPTRSELDSAHRRIADLTRRLAKLEASLSGVGAESGGASVAASEQVNAESSRSRRARPVQKEGRPSATVKTNKRAVSPRKRVRSKATPSGPSFAESLAKARARTQVSARGSKRGKP